MHVGPTGQRTIFVASERAPFDFVVADVTDPTKPEVVYRHELPGPHVRSNNLAIFEDVLAVTRQAKERGGSPAGVEFFDISTPSAPRSIGFFDASGGASIGTHFVWLAGDGYAYLASQSADYAPRDPRDQFMLRILDVSVPREPPRPADGGCRVCRSTTRHRCRCGRTNDSRRPAARALTSEQLATRRVDINGTSSWDFGFRVHNIAVLPEQADRAYVAYTSGGGFILDISDRSNVSVAGALQYSSPLPAAAHTFVPLGASGFGLLSDETLEDGAADFPQGVWVVDARIESRPLIVGSLDLPWPEVVPTKGRFGAHNLHEYPVGQGAWRSFDLAAGAFFGLGVGVYDVSSPLRPREIARFVPGPDASGPSQGQLNDVFVDDRAIVYTIDRRSDVCYILELEGAN